MSRKTLAGALAAAALALSAQAAAAEDLKICVEGAYPPFSETTASGAAYLAGLATGTWKSKSEIAKQWKIARRFNPSMKPANRKTLVLGWIKALKQATKQYELYFNYIIDMQTIES